MDLFVIRHAIAEERRSDLADAERDLTAEGHARFISVVEGMTRAKLGFDLVLTSPWRRARRTAALLSPLSSGELRSVEALARTPDPGLLEILAPLEGSVALVGHEPWLGMLVAWLSTGDPEGASVVMKKGGYTWLRGAPAPGAMSLRALVPPRLGAR